MPRGENASDCAGSDCAGRGGRARAGRGAGAETVQGTESHSTQPPL